jgi:hypothetical protein
VRGVIQMRGYLLVSFWVVWFGGVFWLGLVGGAWVCMASFSFPFCKLGGPVFCQACLRDVSPLSISPSCRGVRPADQCTASKGDDTD